MKTLTILLLSVILAVCNAYSSIDSSDTLSQKVRPKPIKILLASVKFEKGTSELTEHKVEAALALAARLAKNYFLIPADIKDTALHRLTERGEEPTAINMAKELGIDRLLFLRVNRLRHMLRVDMKSYTIDTALNSRESYGYAYLNYRRDSDSVFLYDPSLLLAIQRAFAVAEGDSNLYASLEGSFRAIPVPTLAVGGIAFSNDTRLRNWELFQYKEVTAFDIVETIFEELSKMNRFAVYDSETRDSIYLMNNLYGIDNSQKPTLYEIEALQSLNVEYFVTGSFNRTESGADISISLLDISKDKIRVLNTIEGSINDDDLDLLRIRLRTMVNKLITENK